MDTRDAERLARLSKGAVKLGLVLALIPAKLLLRRLLPDAEPIDRERWAPVDEGAPSVGDVSTTSADGGPGPEIHVEAPWPGYDAMTVAQVRDRLRGADPALRAMVRLYEERHRNRKGVLQATA